jgi:geranylgeranyl reductase family protein
LHVTEHEVIIVGAGPAGSTAAAALARRGRDVLLLDRAEFPRDKPCGDGIPPGTVGILNDLGLGEALHDARFEPVRAIRLVSGRGRDFNLDIAPKRPGTEFIIAPRVHFDELLRRHAIASGARFEHAHVRAPLFDGRRIAGVVAQTNGDTHEIKSRVVIGADGATSVVARSLARKKAPEEQRGVAIRGYIDGITTLSHTVEFHFSSRLAPGYGWIFPLGERRANVGVIMRTDRFKRCGVSLETLLDQFLASTDVRRRLEPGARPAGVASWQVPFATPGSAARSFDGALLVGDAGHFVDSVTGEGIHHAVVTAAIAAELADQALARPDRSLEILSTFDARCESAIGGLIRRSYRAQKYVVAHPLMLEALFVAARSGRGRVVSWLNRVSSDFFISEPAADGASRRAD